MKKLIPLLVMALASVSLAKVPAPVLEARKSAVQIVLKEDGKYRAICSGAVVKLERGPRITSAGHCVDSNPAGEYFVLDYKNRLLPVALEEYEFAWPKNDYAIFYSLTVTNVLPALKVAGKRCEVGDDVFSWSGPLGMSLMLYDGIYSGDLHFPTDPEGEATLGGLLNTSLNVDGGASGSIVLNERGEALAVLIGGWVPTVKLHGAFLAPLPN